MGAPVCTKDCQDECPPGWSCQHVAGTEPDVVYICVSDHANLCKPCSTGDNCKGAGGTDDVCVDYGKEGSFCGGGCQIDEDCPWGFACDDTQTVDDIETRQCVADAGVCPCTDKSVDLALWTPCQASNQWGDCAGKRVCTEEGLSPCDAPLPMPEDCNGLDDDCDALVDEPEEVDGNYASLCDDANPCTKDTCSGQDGCSHELLSGNECMDGDVCTTADHCEDGQCVGSPVICDDKNDCTDDLCTEEGGCEYLPNALPCDDADPCTVSDLCKQGECHGFAVDCDCLEDEDCAALDDGDACNGTLVCNTDKLPYQCVVKPESTVECPVPEGPEAICLKAACDPSDGGCSLVPDHEGYACGTGDKCSVGATCVAGSCIGGFLLNCEDVNPCTEDSCDPSDGCQHQPKDGSCSDDNICTSGDLCADGQCVPGEPLVCDDGNPCTADSCDVQAGCIHTPTLAPGESCCGEPSDCPPDYSNPPVCDVQSTCQGSAKTAICINNQCGSTVTEDDSACYGLADDCGLFKDIVCSGNKVQLPVRRRPGVWPGL